MNIYNTIIVGSGISGLYYAYLLKQKGITDFLILEKSNRVGGRIGVDNFHNTDVVTGAGIGRFNKDKLLLSLLKELNVKNTVYDGKINYILSFKEVNIIKILEKLKKYYKKSERHKLTFRDFLIKNLGEDIFYKFVCSSGYTDYLDADVCDTIYDYGFDDNIPGYKGVSIKWLELLEKLVKFISSERVILNCDINNIISKNERWYIECGEQKFISKNLILAIPPKQVSKIIDIKHIDNIQPQSFMRLYVKLDPIISKEFIEKITQFTFLEPPIQKIIPMNPKENVYMLSYSDNKSADWMNKVSLSEIEDIIYKYTGYKIKIIDILKIYWKEGTHYYKPLSDIWKDRESFLKYIQNPYPNLFLVGEAYSRNQGWVEGALESVKNIINI